MKMALPHWAAVLAPLGVPANDGRQLHDQFAPAFTPPAPLVVDTGDGPTSIGRVDMVGVDAGDPAHLVAAGVLFVDSDHLVTAMRNGDLVPAFDLAVHDAEGPFTTGVLYRVIARRADRSSWPGVARFTITMPAGPAPRDPSEPDPAAPCPHCPDGHADPTSRPWGVHVAPQRDGDGQPTHLVVSPSNGAHVADSDAAWLWHLIRNA